MISRAFVGAFVLVTALSAAPASPAASPIQPGSFISTKVGGCTLNFVFTGSTTTFLGTAAHCVTKVGDSVKDQNGTVIGHAAVIGSAAKASTDWALIAIDARYVSRVKPNVLGHAKSPTGYAKSSRVGDEVLFSGYGIPWDETSATRQDRFGFMASQDRSSYKLVGSDTWGDSGGPIVLANSGRAMGIVSRFCFGMCTSQGPTVQGLLQQSAAKGYPVTLRTVAP